MTDDAGPDSLRRLTQWAEEAGRGNREAFDRLCGPAVQHRLRILIDVQLFRGLRGRIDPEDVLQVVLLRAWTSIGELHIRSTGGFLRWIAGIARNTVRGVNRDEGRGIRDWKRELRSASSLSSKLTGGYPTPSRCVWGQEQRASVVARISGLSEAYREVFVLRALSCCSEAETAEILGISCSAVASRMFRACKQLGEDSGGGERVSA